MCFAWLSVYFSVHHRQQRLFTHWHRRHPTPSVGLPGHHSTTSDGLDNLTLINAALWASLLTRFFASNSVSCIARLSGWSRFIFNPTLFALTKKGVLHFFSFLLFLLQIFLTSILRYPRTTSAYLFCFSLFPFRTGRQEAGILGSNQALHSAGGNMGYGERGREAKKKTLLEGKTVSICERSGGSRGVFGKGVRIRVSSLGLGSCKRVRVKWDCFTETRGDSFLLEMQNRLY